MRKKQLRFLPMHPTSSRNGYGVDDTILFNREKTTLRDLDEQGLITVYDRQIRKPTKRGELGIIETQYLASTLAAGDLPVQNWVITEEAFRELHQFTFSGKELSLPEGEAQE